MDCTRAGTGAAGVACRTASPGFSDRDEKSVYPFTCMVARFTVCLLPLFYRLGDKFLVYPNLGSIPGLRYGQADMNEGALLSGYAILQRHFSIPGFCETQFFT